MNMSVEQVADAATVRLDNAGHFGVLDQGNAIHGGDADAERGMRQEKKDRQVRWGVSKRTGEPGQPLRAELASIASLVQRVEEDEPPQPRIVGTLHEAVLVARCCRQQFEARGSAI